MVNWRAFERIFRQRSWFYCLIMAGAWSISGCKESRSSEALSEPITHEVEAAAVVNLEPAQHVEEITEAGPSSVDYGGITKVSKNPEWIERGRVLYYEKTCGECHRMDRHARGPALGGVTQRRDPRWLARMIMHPEQMLKLDPIAKKLQEEFMCLMPDLDVSPEEAEAIIAYLGTYE